MSRRSPTCIVDFFAGTGYDKNGIAGSPIRILEKIREQVGSILNNRVKVLVHLNEYEPDKHPQEKFDQLVSACEDFLNDNPDVRRAIDVHYHNKDFELIFLELRTTIATYPSLVFLDQNGVKFLSPKYLLELEKMRRTDFLYFVAASYIRRFGDVPEFTKYVQIDLNELRNESYEYVHRTYVRQLRKILPAGTKLRLYPFSLKKGSNIYGIVFGASHPLAFDKFLNIAWRTNNENGEADFDIHDEESKRQGHLFQKSYSKIELFQNTLREMVLSSQLKNNIDTYYYALEEGHPARHAALALAKMKLDGEVTFSSRTPWVNYEKAVKKGDKLDFTVVTK